MIFLIHISRGLALEKNVVANRMFPNWCLAVLAKPGILPLTGVGQARGALRAPRHVSRCLECGLRVSLHGTRQTPEDCS